MGAAASPCDLPRFIYMFGKVVSAITRTSRKYQPPINASIPCVPPKVVTLYDRCLEFSKQRKCATLAHRSTTVYVLFRTSTTRNECDNFRTDRATPA